MVTLMIMASKVGDEVWVTQFNYWGHVDVYKGNVHRLGDSTKPWCEVFSKRNGLRSYVITNHGDWHVTEKAALARIKVLIRQRRACLAREAIELDTMDGMIKVGRLPLTKKR